LLQQWYRLCDPALEEAVADRLSFRRFVGLALDSGFPITQVEPVRARRSDETVPSCHPTSSGGN
jgi:IS5 family transposase